MELIPLVGYAVQNRDAVFYSTEIIEGQKEFRGVRRSNDDWQFESRNEGIHVTQVLKYVFV